MAEQTTVLRLALSGHRVLLLLDNVVDEAQVRPLLTAAPGCLTIITCRRALSGLEGVRWLRLTPMPATDSVTLLASIVGTDRVRAEPEAVREVVELCGNLPLAVRIAGNRLAQQLSRTISWLAAELRDERTRLVSLTAGDLQLRAALVLSYQRLSAPAQALFRRLAQIPADFDIELAAIAAPATDVEIRSQLDELVDATMVQPSATPGRYELHDLNRIFARERLEAEDDREERARAADAVHTHLLPTAAQAGALFDPGTDSASSAGLWLMNREWAASWLERESANWLAAIAWGTTRPAGHCGLPRAHAAESCG